jgi:hypothetical protein
MVPYLNPKYPQGTKRRNADMHVKKIPSKSPVRRPTPCSPQNGPYE